MAACSSSWWLNPRHYWATGKELCHETILRVTAAIPLFISPLAMAGENVPDRYGYIGGHASYYTFYENEVYRKDVDGLDNVPFYGGQIGWRFHPNWSVQGWYEDVEAMPRASMTQAVGLICLTTLPVPVIILMITVFSALNLCGFECR